MVACLAGGLALCALRTNLTVVNFLSGVLYVAVLLPLASRLNGAWPRRLALVFVTLYVTGALTDLIEAYFFTTLLTPFTLVAALLVEAVPMLVLAAIVVFLTPTTDAATPPPPALRSYSGWTWRVLVAGALYVPIYFGFASLVAPIEHQFYSDPTFIAQLQTRVPPDSIAIPLEAVRGVLFVLALLPALRVLPGRSWLAWVYLGLIGVVIEAWVPLLGRTDWPVAMRLGNFAELTGDSFARAAVALVLLGTPPLLVTLRRRAFTY